MEFKSSRKTGVREMGKYVMKVKIGGDGGRRTDGSRAEEEMRRR